MTYERPRADPLTVAERSARMAKVRGKGNASTEGCVEAALIQHGILGWVKQPSGFLAKPDFYFPEARLAVFVDGCFWHACPKCARRIPQNRSEFWRAKIEGNRLRDNRQRRKLRGEGTHVMRIWEHDVPSGRWLPRLRALLRRHGSPRVGDTSG